MIWLVFVHHIAKYVLVLLGLQRCLYRGAGGGGAVARNEQCLVGKGHRQFTDGP